MLGDAIAFPKARDGWVKTIVTGGILLGTSVLFLPLLMFLGYHVRVVRSGITADPQPPVFEDWNGLLIDGLKLLTIYIVYGTVPFLVLALSLAGLSVAAPETVPSLPDSVSTGTNIHHSSVSQGVFLTTGLLTLVIGYIALAATARFAHEERFSAAFELRAVVRTAFTSEFFVGVVLFQAVWVVLGGVGVALLSVIIGFFFIFYTYIVAWYLIGRGYRNANARRKHTDAWAA